MAKVRTGDDALRSGAELVMSQMVDGEMLNPENYPPWARVLSEAECARCWAVVNEVLDRGETVTVQDVAMMVLSEADVEGLRIALAGTIAGLPPDPSRLVPFIGLEAPAIGPEPMRENLGIGAANGLVVIPCALTAEG